MKISLAKRQSCIAKIVMRVGIFFLVSVGVSFAQTVSFDSAALFTVGANQSAVAVGDFNRDGRPDLALATAGNNVAILLGIGGGLFGAPTTFGVGLNPRAVAIGDFNGDGREDLAVANALSNNVSILLGTVTGSFGSASNFAVDSSPTAIVVGDFNGDGKQDLAVANSVSNNVSILLGTGIGSFVASSSFAVGAAPVGLASGDFNRDGRIDLAVANSNSSNVSMLLGTGTGNFITATNFAVGFNPRAVAVGDFNRDGRDDLVVAHANNVAILLGDGNGGFGTANSLFAGSNARAVAIGDFNGDGKQDVAVALGDDNAVSVLTGNGNGSFLAPISFAAGVSPIGVAVGDFDADGKQDLVVALAFSNGVARLQNVAVIKVTNVAASVLPSSRSVRVGSIATAFASVVNAGANTASGCGISAISQLPAALSFQTTDPTTNEVTNSSNMVVNIEAGATQSFVIGLTPTAQIAPTDMQLSFDCANSSPAPIIVGVNTLLLTASAAPAPDIVALAATLNNDGIVDIPVTTGTGVFAVATVNLGSSGSIEATADTGAVTLPVTILMCETNPANSQCVNPLVPTTSAVVTTINANATPTFGIFVQGTENVVFNPALNRIFVRFKDADVITRGSTSVAVRTQ